MSRFQRLLTCVACGQQNPMPLHLFDPLSSCEASSSKAKQAMPVWIPATDWFHSHFQTSPDSGAVDIH